MRIVGIVGGVACGKSTVTDLLAQQGAAVLDADRAGHDALAENDVKQALIERWGHTILNTAGEVDRARVAEIVFAPTPDGLQERKFLEQLTHPRIKNQLKLRAEQFAAQGKKAAVLDAALLLEAGWKQLCDAVIFVESPRQLRLARARMRGWCEKDFARREAVQMPIDQKRAAADSIIDNSGSLERLRDQVHSFWNQNIEPTKA